MRRQTDGWEEGPGDLPLDPRALRAPHLPGDTLAQRDPPLQLNLQPEQGVLKGNLPSLVSIKSSLNKLFLQDTFLIFTFS